MSGFNLVRYCLDRWALSPDRRRPAFSFLSADDSLRTWTFEEVLAEIERAGRGLLAAGCARGDRVLVALDHSPEYAFAFFGAVAAGLVPMPVSPALTREEVAFLAEDSGAALAVVESGTREALNVPIQLDRHDFAALDGPGPLPATEAEDPAFLIYTSGTTARQKGVLHAHRTVLGRAMMRDAWQGFGPGDVTMHAGTLNWSYTLGVGLMDPWAAGAHAILGDRPSNSAGWIERMRRLDVTVFVAVPTVYRQALKYHDGPIELPRLRHVLCAGEALPPPLLEEWRDRTGTEMYEALGMTEISTYISSGPMTPVRPGSPGRPQPGRHVTILPVEGESTEPLPAGEVGLLAVRRDDPGLMLGYWNRPEEEAAVFRGDWFVGGDTAAIDEDGYVWFHGRSDDIIKSFGYRLSPVEIEAALEGHPDIAEAAVVGHLAEPQKTLVLAYVVPASGAAIDEPSVRSHVAEHLAAYKRPHEYRVVASLPRTPNGKVQRNRLGGDAGAGRG